MTLQNNNREYVTTKKITQVAEDVATGTKKSGGVGGVATTRAKASQETTEECLATIERSEATAGKSQAAAKQEATDRGEGIRARGGQRKAPAGSGTGATYRGEGVRTRGRQRKAPAGSGTGAVTRDRKRRAEALPVDSRAADQVQVTRKRKGAEKSRAHKQSTVVRKMHTMNRFKES
jgi:hypothetical protein